MRRRGEAGYSLVALMAGVTVMLIAMGAAAPTWKHVIQNDREEELLFRGGQIADAIVRYQKKHGGAFPTNLEVLVKGKFLRKAYKDPMTKPGEWRFVRQGESTTPVPRATGPSPRPTPRPPQPGAFGTPALGAIVGVASTSREKSYRIFNGRQRYDEWIFAAGQPRVVGRPLPTPAPGRAPGVPGGASRSSSPPGGP